MVEFRKFCIKDGAQCAQLFYDTIHYINAKDYNKEQLDAWAPPVTEDVIARFCTFLEINRSFVAVVGEQIVGFTDLQKDGYYNCLFVHKDFQGQGVASGLYGCVEDEAKQLGLAELTTEASITARPFFEKRGFQVQKEQEKRHNGVLLKNFVMKKTIQGGSIQS